MKTVKIIVRGGVVEAIDVPLGTQLEVMDVDNNSEYICRRNIKNGRIEEHPVLQTKLFMEVGA